MGGLISKVINKREEYITGDKDYEDPKITLNDII